MQEKNYSIHKLVTDLIRNQKLGVIIFIILILSIISFIIMDTYNYINNTSNTWSTFFKYQLERVSKTSNDIFSSTTNNYSALKIDLSGEIINSTDKNFIGVNIVNSKIFKRALELNNFEEILILESGIMKSKLMTYHLYKEKRHIVAIIFEPEVFFPIQSDNTLFIMSDNKNVVSYSSNFTFIGEVLKPARFILKDLKIYLIEEININKNVAYKVYLLQDTSLKIYVILASGFILFLLLIFLNKNLNIFIAKLRRLDTESKKLNSMVKELLVYDSINSVGGEEQVQRFKEAILKFLYRAESLKFNFNVSRYNVERYKTLVESVLILLNRTDRIMTNLKETKNRYKSIYNNILEGVFQSTIGCLLITANDSLVHMLGYENFSEMEREINIKKRRFFKSDKDREFFFNTFIKTDSIKHYSTKLIMKNGDELSVILSGTRVLDDHNKTLYIQGNIRDVSAVEQAKLLREEKEKAEAISQTKSAFLANVSHELRTPLNSVIGFSELLAANITDKKLRSYTDAILTAGKSLLTLIRDILDLSKIEANQLNIEKSPVSVESIISDIIQIFSLTASAKQIELIKTIPSNFPKQILLDESRLRQILINLVGNAIKFTETGNITISVTAEDIINDSLIPYLIFSVEDTGRGIPKESLNDVFKEFKQVGNQSGKKGSGLGLAICKRLVKLMNGSIGVESEVNKGSLFTFLLNDIEISKSYNREKNKSIEQNIHTYNSIKFARASVLIVDDSESIRDYVKEVLTLLNLTVFSAENGKLGLEILESVRPDLILMDIKMPVMNGYDTTLYIKNSQKYKDIPVVAFTASIDEGSIEELKKYGFNGYLSKPIKISVLTEELAKHLKHTIHNPEIKKEIEVQQQNLKISKHTLSQLKDIWPNTNSSGLIIKLSNIDAIIDILEKSEHKNISEKFRTLKNNYDIQGIELLIRDISKENSLEEL